jgi:ABC-type nickel/cobalt efflux system permease component RcnA
MTYIRFFTLSFLAVITVTLGMAIRALMKLANLAIHFKQRAIKYFSDQYIK